MADVTGPGGQPMHDPLTVSRTQPVNPDKSTPEEIAKKNPQGLLMAGFCAYVKTMATFLTNSATKKRGALSGGGLEQYLMEFKKSLTILTVEDQSQNQEYVFHLSNVWHALLENLNLVEFLERKKSPLIARVKVLIQAIRAYPPNEEHSLGFYMTEYAERLAPVPLHGTAP